MKRKRDDWISILALLLAVGFLLSATAIPVAAENTGVLDPFDDDDPQRGDVNGDGKVDARDYMMTKRAVLGTYTLSAVQNLAADVDGNGTVNARDYMMLKRAVLGTYTL